MQSGESSFFKGKRDDCDFLRILSSHFVITTYGEQSKKQRLRDFSPSPPRRRFELKNRTCWHNLQILKAVGSKLFRSGSCSNIGTATNRRRPKIHGIRNSVVTGPFRFGARPGSSFSTRENEKALWIIMGSLDSCLNVSHNGLRQSSVALVGEKEPISFVSICVLQVIRHSDRVSSHNNQVASIMCSILIVLKSHFEQ